MNNYLGRDEKNNLVRLMILKVQLEKVLEIYSSLKNIDKAFLADLRHSKTRLHKATEVRIGYLDDEAKANLLLSIAKLHITFLPTPEAKKAHKEMLELQNVMPMEVDDFQNWYEFIIESTCKPCTKPDYEECPARRVLLKYGIFPVDPGEKDKCQYSYVGTPKAEELQPVDTNKTVPAIVYNAALAMGKAKEDSIIENYVPAIKQLQAEVEELNKEISVAKEQIEDLQEKNAKYIERNQELYTQISEYDRLLLEIELLKIDSANYEKNINCVVDLKDELQSKCDQLTIENGRLTRGYYAIQDLIRTIHKKESPQQLPFAQPQNIQTSEQRDRFRVECYCGAEYFADMYNGFREGRKKARCNMCRQEVFLDPQADKLIDPRDGVKATLLTNRYYVSNEPQKPQQPAQEIVYAIPLKSKEAAPVSDLRSIKNVGRDYKDPCQLLG